MEKCGFLFTCSSAANGVAKPCRAYHSQNLGNLSSTCQFKAAVSPGSALFDITVAYVVYY